MIKNKLIPSAQIADVAASLHRDNKKIVFTNGCFDILHAGHVLYLESAKQLGDILVLGLNSDASVKRLKGETRPIVAQYERSIVIAALEAVDYVVIFDEDTPYQLIKLIQPDVLVKGGDWTVDKIIGSDIVQSYGGDVKSLCYEDGVSSTSIIDKILNLRQV
ncbi:MAG: D-glycero-beta-D-manno-heptose 1-phosphate adenylyltransferase [Candidatus Cloacimonetes bacterium]|nr:D-glycero-beta-D-manno-heptose 1-phosphate adenylyltransferase [Candidatus Cloacimonadota bacterium]